MIKSLETSMLGISHDLRELAPYCVKYGIEAIGAQGALFQDEKTAADMAAVMEHYGLKWGLLPMPADFYFWDLSDEAFDAAIVELERRAVIGEKLGIRHAYNHVWSSGSRPFDENFEWHVKRVRKVAHTLSEHGIHYGLEFLGPHELRTLAPHPFVHSLSGVLAIADAAGGEAGIAFDAYHWYCSNNGDAGDMLWMETHPDRLVAFHMNDAVPGLPYNEQKDMVRRLPMDSGIIDTRGLLARFNKPGCDALYMIEPFQPAAGYFGTLSPEEAVRQAAEVFARVENK